MQFTTNWLLPTKVAQDDTIGDSDWAEADSIFVDNFDIGYPYAFSFFLSGGEQFVFRKAHLVFNDVPVYANNKVAGSGDPYPFANVGGASDIWSESSITGDEVNNGKFGVAISIGDLVGGVYSDRSYYLVATGFDLPFPDDVVVNGIELDLVEDIYAGGGGTTGLALYAVKIRVTYTWDVNINAEATSFGGIFVDPPNRQLPQKKYRYKVFSPEGDYLGDWKDVANDPTYKQDINNLIGAMPISFARNDLSVEPAVDELLNEDDSPLTNEDDSPFLIDVRPLAALGEGTNLDTNYDVEVDAIYGQFEPLLNEDDTPILNEDGSMILVEEGFPLGRPIFRGYVPRWELPLSGQGITSEIRSYSQDLANEPLLTSDTGDIINTTLSDEFYGINGGGPTDYDGLGQTFTVSGGPKTYSKIRLYAFAGYYFDVDFSVVVRGGTPASPTTTYGSGEAIANRHFPQPYIDVVFDNPITLANGTYCFILDTPYAKTGGNVTYPMNFYKSSSAYAGGTASYHTNDTGWVDSGDLAFELFLAGEDTTVPFLSQDPSDILRAIVDYAAGRGLRINYTEDSIQDTGTTVSYTFRAQTIKEAIEKVLELCPANWYFFYDFGTDTIYLRERSATPDRWLRKGQSVVDGKIVKTIEQVVNDVLFTGGGDPALYIREQEPITSATRRGLKKSSDNRVTVEATARILAQSDIDQFKDPLYAGDVIITEDGEFYLEDVQVGEMLAFVGFGRLVDAIVVQSVSKDYAPDKMPLALTYNVPRVNKRVEDIKRNLDTLETTNNPDAPS